jgi:RimJ/RimL family protein N-acetyltransferase
MLILETPRLMVRQLRDDDLDNLYAITGDAELMRYVGDNQPLSREDTARWIAVSQANYRGQGFGCSAVINKAGGDFIGYCGLVYTPHTEKPHEAEIIYALKKDYWGQGLASEVAGAMLAYGFRQQHLTRIIATVDPENAASVRILEKLGMTYVRTDVDEHNLPTAFYALGRPATMA